MSEIPKKPTVFRASRPIIRSLKAKADRSRTPSEIAADFLTQKFGSIPFLLLNAFWFAVWIVLNLGLIPGVEPFDPFPFGLLTMIVSLEAIMLAIVVLISQNRGAKIEDLREEIDLQVDIITEQEVTKLIEIVAKIAEKQKVDLSNDHALSEMLKPTNPEKLERALEKQVNKG